MLPLFYPAIAQKSAEVANDFKGLAATMNCSTLQVKFSMISTKVTFQV